MPIVDNEQSVKKESLFLKYELGEGGNELMLKSKLYQIRFHFMNDIKKSVACIGEGCVFCANAYQKRSEYNYWVYLNGQIGMMDIKPSVFFAIQGISKAQKKDPRQISWTVIKTGQGLDTEYTTSKNDNLTPEDFAQVETEVSANTDKLSQMMVKREEQLARNYDMYKAQAKPQGKKPAPKPETTQAEPPLPEEPTGTDVDPDEIPF